MKFLNTEKILALSVAAALVGCSSSDSPTTQTQGPTVSAAPQTTVGRITGFGSIYVNGVEYDTNGASYNVDDATASGDDLGRAVSSAGDVNGDGVADLAIGAPGDDSNGSDRGAVWILFPRADGTVKAAQKIGAGTGGFGGPLGSDEFGYAVDLDGGLLADALYQALYMQEMHSLIPYLVDRADKGDYQFVASVLLPLMLFDDTMAIGMYVAVVCAEHGDTDSSDLSYAGLARRLEESGKESAAAMLEDNSARAE
mgnify:CR=1 FL=1